MAVGVIAQLEAQAAQSTASRISAEMAERSAMFAVETAKAAASTASRRWAELAETVEQASAAEQAARDRLGPCRLAHADAERELERLADTAAQGSDPAARAIAKARDAVETAASIVAAHERRTRVLAGERELAEAALAAHDADAALNIQRARESLVAQVAALVDSRLEESGTAALQFVSLLDDARAARIPTGWAAAWGSNAPLTQYLRCAHHFADRLEPGHATSGGGGRLYWRFSRFAGDFIGSWRAGRGEDAAEQAQVEPASAATVEHPAEAA